MEVHKQVKHRNHQNTIKTNHGDDRNDFVGAVELGRDDERFGELRLDWELGHSVFARK